MTMVITFFVPCVKNTQDRLDNLVNFQRTLHRSNGQFSARVNTAMRRLSISIPRRVSSSSADDADIYFAERIPSGGSFIELHFGKNDSIATLVVLLTQNGEEE